MEKSEEERGWGKKRQLKGREEVGEMSLLNIMAEGNG